MSADYGLRFSLCTPHLLDFAPYEELLHVPPCRLMYAERDLSVAGMVLDSPFANLPNLIPELVEHMKLPLPKFTVSREDEDSWLKAGKCGLP